MVHLLRGAEPHCEWLPPAVARDDRGFVLTGRDVPPERWPGGLPPASLETTVPGVFAAGDCTTVPYKQIVVSLGAGATASLSAFDHLIRTSAPAKAMANAG